MPLEVYTRSAPRFVWSPDTVITHDVLLQTIQDLLCPVLQVRLLLRHLTAPRAVVDGGPDSQHTLCRPGVSSGPQSRVLCNLAIATSDMLPQAIVLTQNVSVQRDLVVGLLHQGPVVVLDSVVGKEWWNLQSMSGSAHIAYLCTHHEDEICPELWLIRTMRDRSILGLSSVLATPSEMTRGVNSPLGHRRADSSTLAPPHCHTSPP